MKRGIGATLAIVTLALVAGAAVLSADRLILRDGRRIEGELVGVQRGMIEFREQRGWRDTRVIQVPRAEVERIELEPARGMEDRRPDRPEGRSEGRPRPGGMREREVWVSANTPWTDTGIDVRDGQSVFLDTHGGDILWRRGSHAKAGGDESGRYDAARPIPSRPVGALIGKLNRDSRDYFFIGDSEGPVRVRSGGRLFLGVNDSNLTDNQGAFRVTVYY
jgi:hypothetical protein